MLKILHPHVAAISCKKCSKFACNLKTGEYFTQGNLLVRRGPEGPPCLSDPKICPKGKPGKSDLTLQNQQVLEHYYQCDAVSEWPDDEWVRLNARILKQTIQEARELANRRSSRQDIERLAMAIMRAKGG
jgi:hypothetical protein